jgi:hypothetical protein
MPSRAGRRDQGGVSPPTRLGRTGVPRGRPQNQWAHQWLGSSTSRTARQAHSSPRFDQSLEEAIAGIGLRAADVPRVRAGSRHPRGNRTPRADWQIGRHHPRSCRADPAARADGRTPAGRCDQLRGNSRLNGRPRTSASGGGLSPSRESTSSSCADAPLRANQSDGGHPSNAAGSESSWR